MQRAYVPPHRRQIEKPPVKKAKRPIVPLQSFDIESGQVYNEVEVIFKRKHNSDWIGESKTPSIVKNSNLNNSRPRSLFDMATSKCVKEFRNFTPAHFENIPWSVASAIWAEISATHAESFHTWRTFATVYNHYQEFGRPEHRYLLEIKQPPLPVQEYYRGISGADAKWLSALRISPKQTSVPELVAIATIENLTVLDLSDGQLILDLTSSRFDERVMRTWAELASSGRAFKHLQVLMLGWQDHASSWIFKYTKSFPRLRSIITTDCKNLHQKNRSEWEEPAESYGWLAHHAKKSVKMLRPVLSDEKFHIASVSSLYYHETDGSATPKHFETSEDAKSPIVECWLGSPRKWTHIMDEFPGTRTVWFETTDASSRTGVSGDSARTKRQMEEATSRESLRKRSASRGKPLRRAPITTAASLLAEMGV